MSGRFVKHLLLIVLTVQLVGLACSTTTSSGPTIVTVEVTPDSAEVQAGATQLYTARALDGSGNQITGVSFTWSSADESVATVDANGMATGVVLGVTDIRASASGRTGSARISVLPNTNADLPDDQFIDSNADGIDGDIAKAVFVAATGNDANDGTPDSPKLTIGAAITAATGDATKTEVYVSSGTYTETVQLSAGVSVYGGYDAAADWARSASNVATVQGDTTAVTGDGITQQTTVDRLTIESADNTVAGGNSTGIYLANSNSVTLRNLTVNAGDGAAGTAGGVGAAGAGGQNGQAGVGSSGGLGAVGAGPNGGNGGDGATSWPTGQGLPGGVGLGGSPGAGGGGGATNPACDGVTQFAAADGSPGGNGGAVANGPNGAGGDGVGSVVSGFWRGSAGANGTVGGSGNGGGGGGGGGFGPNDPPQCPDFPDGGGGGGGGAGGTGGTEGTGGTGGGGSFALFAFNTTVTVELSTLTAGNGGAGGAGADGGVGGSGGLGGGGAAGAVFPTGKGGDGGNGGNGSAGGNGGAGGGGGGGVSYAAYSAGTSTVTLDSQTDADLTAGTGGAGGTAPSGGNPGTQGQSGQKNF